MYRIVCRVVLFVVVVVGFLSACRHDVDYESVRSRLDGRYGLVDRRNVLTGPGSANEVYCGRLIITTSADGRVVLSGIIEAEGELVGRNIRIPPFTVNAGDGTSLLYSFGILEADSDLYVVSGDYSVSGTVMNPFGDVVDYVASGEVEGRKISR